MANQAPRIIATMLLSSVLTVFWAHGLGSITSHFSDSSSIAAWPVTIAAILGAIVTTWIALKRSKKAAAVYGFALGALSTLVINLLVFGEWDRALPLLLLLPTVACFSLTIFNKIPETFNSLATKSKPRAALLLILTLATLTQTARLTTYMADVEKGFPIMSNSKGPLHECIGGYLYAAELNMRGEENIYNSDLYKARNRDAKTASKIQNLPTPDAYFYPPQFLLLSQTAVTLTNDIAIIRQMWLAIQATLVIAVALSLALWIGGRTGGYAATLFPLAFISVPSLHALHFGQFHYATIALAIGGMLALSKGKKIVGAGMLGFAIVAKIFPIVLLIGLAIRKKWAELAYTVGAIIIVTAIAYFVVGPQAFKMFFTDMLPRLSDGSIANYKINEPNEIGRYITANQSIFGSLQKLVALDILNITFENAITIAKAISLTAIIAAIIGYAKKENSNEDKAINWIALIGLASILGTLALGDYVPVAVLWLATILIARTKSSTTFKVLVALTWLTHFLPFTGERIFGFVQYPLFTWLSLLSANVMAAVFILSLYQRSETAETSS